MADQVFRPLGMGDSSYVWEDGFQQLFVQGHAPDGTSRASRRFKAPVVAATLYTTAADYGRFLGALLNDDDALRALMSSPVQVDSKLKLTWGLGWGIEKEGDDTVIWHWGNRMTALLGNT
jgi:CubicO group peptidase (beta-lactamase class C family)